MHDEQYEILENIKQVQLDLFEKLSGNELYSKIHTEYGTVKDVDGVKELKNAAEEFNKILNALYSSLNVGKKLSNVDFELVEEKLEKIKNCIDKIDWGYLSPRD